MSLVASNPDFWNSLSVGASVCALKLATVHLLGVRTRLMSAYTAQPADKQQASWFLNAVRLSLGGLGPDFGGAAFVDRCERIAKNCAENEPFFFIMAALYGLTTTATLSGTATTLVNVYVISRFAHTVSYLVYPFGTKTSMRALSFTVALGASTTMAIMSLQR